MSDPIVINSVPALLAAIGKLRMLFEEHKYLSLVVRIGTDRSLDQNALFHVWHTEYAAYLLSKDKRNVTRGELEGVKRITKKNYYNETGLAHMVHRVVNPFNPEQSKLDYTSSADWKQGEMFDFLTWLQMKAAGDGLVLESKGEFNKLQKQQRAAA